MTTLQLDIKDDAQMALLGDFLRRCELVFDGQIDTAFVIMQNGQIIASICKQNRLIKFLAICANYQGQGLFERLLKRLILHAQEAKIYTLRVCTKAQNAVKFCAFGFRQIAQSEQVALLEIGPSLFEEFLRESRQKIAEKFAQDGADGSHRGGANGGYGGADGGQMRFDLGAVVMNANPFSKGHEYLVCEALRQCRRLVVFVLSEDKSLFSSDERLALVRANLRDYDRVCVLAGGDYIVSSATFASYFLKAEPNAAQADLDARVFCERIAPALGISARFVGSEPFCALTAGYNDALAAASRRSGVALVQIERLKSARGSISASEVRKLLLAGQMSELRELVSEVTFEAIRQKYGR